ncbi:BnaC09g42840D [Brassica napus]|uniref:BnaC09g42840D protein n=1 Tax=Brassica napus TaxID=3708 RepID=A0A078F9Y4_BRANA|nr:BnaC09g42840D [Brassica napus]
MEENPHRVSLSFTGIQ